MAKPRPRIGWSRYPHIRSHKTAACKISKGVIHVQASFHNIIVTVVDVGGQVVS